MTDQDRNEINIYYDGECPFCSNYVRLLHLREEVGAVNLINLRTNPHERQRFLAEDCDLDEGMVVEIDGRHHHGHDAVHALATLSAPSGPISWFNKRLFRSANRSRILYPFMRAGRNATLRLLGRSKLCDQR